MLPLLPFDIGFGFALDLTLVVSEYVIDFNIQLDMMSFVVNFPSTKDRLR